MEAVEILTYLGLTARGEWKVVSCESPFDSIAPPATQNIAPTTTSKIKYLSLALLSPNTRPAAFSFHFLFPIQSRPETSTPAHRIRVSSHRGLFTKFLSTVHCTATPVSSRGIANSPSVSREEWWKHKTYFLLPVPPSQGPSTSNWM